ncbi:MerR family transcriptional regulator [Halopseudomonas salina]|uniref:MerR family transcriptional regulator n=1 Tax=Halopseudomonas salina TaxID=1323744 RepID=A0ABQ1Q453_9GAMM|nr:MerR family transcriptional regulator [Halopseudomonas salina]GGD11074.1 MerR family transcriptional regulator [Halopseudomonas salina]
MTKTNDPMYAALDAELEGEDLYPIREVSRLTGVNPVTLRAWERRYGLLVPHRTDSGHRLYSMADIERVRKVTAWIDRGVAVSKVASIIDREVAVSQASVVEHESSRADGAAGLREWQAKLVDAVNSVDLGRLDSVYGQVYSTFPVVTVLRDIVLPVWQMFRDNADPNGISGQWSFLDAFVRGRLFQRISYLRPGLPTVLMAALPGYGHEFEFLSAAAVVAEADANVTLVPGISSYAELTAMAEQSGCDLLLLYGNHALDPEALSKSLPRLEQSLACQVAVAGPVCAVQPAELERAGIRVLAVQGQEVITQVRGLLMGRFDPPPN